MPACEWSVAYSWVPRKSLTVRGALTLVEGPAALVGVRSLVSTGCRKSDRMSEWDWSWDHSRV